MKNRKSLRKLFYSLYLLALLGLGGGLISQIVHAEETKPEATEKKDVKDITGNFARGAKLWAGRCSSCHNMRDPKDLPDDQWKATVTHMRLRAGLTGQDARDILEFLQKVN